MILMKPSSASYPYTVLNSLLDLLTFESYQEFSAAFTQYQTDTISKFSIIEGAKNFSEEGRYLFRKSLRSLFLATLLRVVKINFTKSAGKESVVKSWEVLIRNYKLHQSYVWILKKKLPLSFTLVSLLSGENSFL